MSYAISLPYTDKTIVVNCKCGTDSILTWVRQVIKGWTLDRSLARNIHRRMRPAVHSGTIYGPTIFVVRDPASRFLSCYYDRINRKEAKTYNPHITLDGFIERLRKRSYRHSDEHWRPQFTMAKWIHDIDKAEFLTIGSLERVLSTYLSDVGCPCPRLVNLKDSRRRYEGGPEDHLSPEQILSINEIYNKDYELYQKALGHPRS